MSALTQGIAIALSLALVAQSACYAGVAPSLSRQKDLQSQSETAPTGALLPWQAKAARSLSDSPSSELGAKASAVSPSTKIAALDPDDSPSHSLGPAALNPGQAHSGPPSTLWAGANQGADASLQAGPGKSAGSPLTRADTGNSSGSPPETTEQSLASCQPTKIAVLGHAQSAQKNSGHILPLLPPEEPVPPTSLPLSPTTLAVAKDIGILPQLERLAMLKHKYLQSTAENMHLDILATRQEIDEQVLSTMLETNSTVSLLDTQIAQFDAVADFMEGKRDKSIRNNSIFNFSSSGAMQALASAVQVGTGDFNGIQNAGNELEVIQASFQLLVSLYALKLAKGKTRSAPRSMNMLAPVLGREPVDYDKYPPAVWSYLNDTPVAGTETRRETLVKRWIELGRIQPLNKHGSAEELDALCGTVDLPKSVTIDLLRNRIPMMEDVRAVVSSINRSLHEIMNWVRTR